MLVFVCISDGRSSFSQQMVDCQVPLALKPEHKKSHAGSDWRSIWGWLLIELVQNFIQAWFECVQKPICLPFKLTADGQAYRDASLMRQEPLQKRGSETKGLNGCWCVDWPCCSVEREGSQVSVLFCHPFPGGGGGQKRGVYWLPLPAI